MEIDIDSVCKLYLNKHPRKIECDSLPSDSLETVIHTYELFNADNLLNTSDMLQHKWRAS